MALVCVLALVSCEVKTGEETLPETEEVTTAADETAEETTAGETTSSETQAATAAETTAAATTAAATTVPATTAPATTVPATTAPATTAKPETTVPVTEPPAPEVTVPTMASAVKEPQPGDDPKTLSGIENVMRIAYVLQHAENYTVNGKGTVSATVLFFSYEQKVEVYKDYKDGVLIEIDVTDSSLVSDAWQICYVGDKALSREPSSSSSSSWNGRKTAWKTGAPTIYTRDGYRSQYGLFGFELTNYVLTPDTVTKWGSVTDNGDGTYTETIEPDLTKATGDVVVRMKTMGGLSEKPKFKKSQITLTFDANWRILSMRIKETYSAKMSGFNADSCAADTTYTYAYGNADISAYTSFFSKYAN